MRSARLEARGNGPLHGRHPARAEKPDAWKKLGFIKQKNRWVRPEQATAEETERKAQSEATARWEPKLTTWRTWLASATPDLKTQAAQQLATVTDPRAVPVVWKVFVVKGRGTHLQEAVQLFGQLDTPAAAPPLIALAVSADDPQVRRTASETLTQRDPRESLDTLIRLIRTPTRYNVQDKTGKDGHVVRRVLKVEAQSFNLNREYVAPPPPPDSSQLWMKALRSPDVQGAKVAAARLNSGGALTSQDRLTTLLLRGQIVLADTQVRVQQNAAAYRNALTATEQQFQRDVATLDAQNAVITQTNARVVPLLESMTGEQLGDDAEAWTKWWADEQGYSYQPPEKQNFYQRAPRYQPSYSSSVLRFRHACFAKGTLVQTLDGPKLIETLRIGDRVLSQDIHNGTLLYEPVLAVFHNRPNATLRVHLDGSDTPIVATPIHRFWRIGQGWVMTRELKPGDRIRIVGGLARVTEITEDKVQPVFNLEIAQTHSFFVGARLALVHDNSLIEPVSEPFDAEPAIGSVARSD